MHAYVMRIGGMYTCANDCTWHMYMIPMCYIHAYISISISELHYPLEGRGSEVRSWRLHIYLCYLHTCLHVAHMHIGIWHVNMWCICTHRDMTYTYVCVNVTHVYKCVYMAPTYIYTCVTHIHMHMWWRYICYMCTYDYAHITWLLQKRFTLHMHMLHIHIHMHM